MSELQAAMRRVDAQEADDDQADVYARAAQTWARHQSERDALDREVKRLSYADHCSKVEIEALNIRLNALGSDFERLQAERDALVAEKCHVETMLSGIKAFLEGVEARPVRAARKKIVPPADASQVLVS